MSALVSAWPSRPGLEFAGLKLTLLEAEADLEALAPAWQRLLERSACHSIFLEPGWLLTWWRVFGASSGRQLCVGMFHEGTELVGLAPLCRRRFWHRPGIPFRRLELLGSDFDEPDGVCSEYLNLIVRKGHEQAVAQAFVRELDNGAFGAWDELVMPAMNGESPVPQLLCECLRERALDVELTTVDHAVYVPLPDSWEAYLEGLSANTRKHVRSWLRHFERWAGDDIKFEKVGNAEQLEAGKRILKELHGQRWQADGESGCFAFPRLERFHDLYMPLALAEGKLDLKWLSVKGEPLAALYNLNTAGKTYFYQSGRKMGVPATVRLGKVQLIYALQQAIAQGMTEFDFLGGVAQYKLDFSKSQRPLVQLRTTRGGLRERLKRLAEHGYAWARKLRDACRRTKPAAPTECHAATPSNPP